MPTKPSLKIDWATHEAAKYACENWHYSRVLPSTMQKRFALGAWESGKFIGVVVFGHGANRNAGSPYGLTVFQVCELTRIALAPGHKSPVSRIVRIALKFLKASNPGIRLIISYADTAQGHHGGVYQAGNWIYVGVSRAQSSVMKDGKPIHKKAASTSNGSIKGMKRTMGSAKHKYLMPLDEEISKQINPLRKPYPKRAGSKDSVASGFQSEEGGAIPTPALQSSEVNNG